MEGGITLAYAVEVAKTLEAAGADALNVSCAVYETVPNMIEPNYYEEGWRKELAKTVKAHVKIPVIAVNTIKFPAHGRKAAGGGRQRLRWCLPRADGRPGMGQQG